MGIQKKLQLIIALIGIIPLLVLSYFAISHTKADMSESIGQNSGRATFTKVTNIENNIDGDLAKLITWAGFESFITAGEMAEDDDDRSVHAMLEGLKNNYKSDNDIHVYAVDGEEIIRAAVSDDALLKDPIYGEVEILLNKLQNSQSKAVYIIGDSKDTETETLLTLDMASSIIADDELVGIVVWKKTYLIGREQSKSDFTLLLDKEGKVVSRPGFLFSDEYKNSWGEIEASNLNELLPTDKVVGYFITDIGKNSYLTSFGRYVEENEAEATWSMLTLQNVDVALKSIDELSDLFLQIIVIVGIITLILGFVFSKKIVGIPITNISTAMNTIASGDNETKIPYIKQNDEIGRIAQALEVFRKNALEKIRLEQENKKAMENAEIEKKQGMEDLANSFEERVQGIINTVSSAAADLAQTAGYMSDSIGKSGQIVEGAVVGASETSVNVQSVASAAEEMSQSVREISEQMINTNKLVSDSMSKLASADSHAASLTNATKKVDEVTQLISDIAEQINLLALNATIESARAGEAGKGFAVVANEVKNLAGQTNDSIVEIGKVISEMNAASDDIVMVLGDIKSSVSNISEASTSVASAVEEQSATTDDISRNMQTAANGTENISKNLQEVSQSSNESIDNAQHVLTAAEDLSKQAEDLDNQVKSFLSEIRSA